MTNPCTASELLSLGGRAPQGLDKIINRLTDDTQQRKAIVSYSFTVNRANNEAAVDSTLYRCLIGYRPKIDEATID
jgi:hypothetical protein